MVDNEKVVSDVCGFFWWTARRWSTGLLDLAGGHRSPRFVGCWWTATIPGYAIVDLSGRISPDTRVDLARF